ncbi:hypothetical protein M8C21_006158, partial [Ambrosia artemisiifolia]
ESSRRGSNLRNLSSSSSVFFSANQSPFPSPRSSFWQPANDGHVQAATSTSHNLLPYTTCHENEAFDHIEKSKKVLKSPLSSFTPPSTSYCPTRLRNFDVYVGFHGKKALLLRFIERNVATQENITL